MSERAQRITGIAVIVVAHVAFCFWLGSVLPVDVSSVIALLTGMVVGAFAVTAIMRLPPSKALSSQPQKGE